MWKRNTTTGTAIVYKNSKNENIVLDYKLDGDIVSEFSNNYTKMFQVNKMEHCFLQRLNILVNNQGTLMLKKIKFDYTKLKDNTIYKIRFFAVYRTVFYENYDDSIYILNNGETITACDEGFYVIDCKETTSNKIDSVEPKFGDFVHIYDHIGDNFIRGVVIKRINALGKYLIITDKNTKGEHLNIERFIKKGSPQKDSYAYL